MNRITQRWLGPQASRWLAVAGTAAALVAAAAVPAAAAPPAGPPTGPTGGAAARYPVATGSLDPHPACATPAPGHMACQAIVDTGLHWTGRAWTTSAGAEASTKTAPPQTTPDTGQPAPFMAADLRDAYRLPSGLLGGRQTIAVVDAYDAPRIEADLAEYRAANGLPPCDDDFPCFDKVNQRGEHGDYPPPNRGWALEASLDVQMASAICPNCKVVLVEADDNTFASLAAAEDEAAALGADMISNSYGAIEQPGELDLAEHYDHPGIAITVSSGDAGFGASVPAAFASVTAVGGTTLYRDDSLHGWSELGWRGAGSGCSAYVRRPAWQHDGLCRMRAMADVAAVADPSTPVAVYDTYTYPGWVAVGGTSAAAPIVAGVYALAGNAGTIGQGASWLYHHRRRLSDVTAGPSSWSNIAPRSNGSCGGSYLCTTRRGYDGPTGWGSPNGIGGF